MRRKFLTKIAGIRNCKSGNATVLLALGMPMLVGGAGLGVDLAQWYSWKRELQFAVDQAAIAGAWARAAEPNGSTFRVRARQEYAANLQVTADFDSGPTITLEDYDSGTDNSIMVVASATSMLPFSAFLTGSSTTVSVSAQAIYEPGVTYNPCLLALDPSASQALKFNGGPTVTSGCGGGALSTSSSAIAFLGESGTYDLSYVVTAGGVVDEHGHMDNGNVVEGARDLEDPFDDLTPPDNATPRSLSCPASTNYSADETVTITITYAYFTGSNRNNLTAYNDYANAQQDSSNSTTTVGVGFETSPTNTSATTTVYTEVEGRGNDKVWERKITTTAKSYANITTNTTTAVNMQPGTYTSFDPACNITLASGIYVIDGATMKINAQYSLAGNGVMFVLKNGAGLQINGGASVNLTAMNATQLMAAGVSSDDAVKLAGMLIFEDPDSRGANNNIINGNASTVMNGIVYLPKSNMDLAGTARGNSACLQVASKKLNIQGTADLENLCPNDVDPRGAIASTTNIVRLVG